MQNKKHSRSRDVAFNLQQQAREQADEEARRIPWQLLQDARRVYIEWQEFYYWTRSVMESEGTVPAWLAERIEDRCPGFLEEVDHSDGQVQESVPTPVRLGSWIDDHVFAFAKNGGWFHAIVFYAVRAPRYQRASVCWSQSVGRWTNARPIRYPCFKEWLAEAAKCDDTANLIPEVRRERQCFKLVSPNRLNKDVARYIDWEAFAYWSRPALERGAPFPDAVASQLQERCPGFWEFNENARTDDDVIQRDWHRLMAWIADHFFVEAKSEGWLDAVLMSVRDHPRAIRTMEYWDHCDGIWASGLPVPYPSFEDWRQRADQFVDLSAS